MKSLAIVLNTRGNEGSLQSTCLALANTAKHPERLKFRLRVDEDDRYTLSACVTLSKRLDLEAIIGSRPESLGAEINKLIASVDADHYLIMGDDVQPYTLHWDLALDQTTQDLTCWALPHREQPPDYPIVSKQWVAAAEGQVFTDRFPFWFDDRWLAELGILVYGQLPKALPIGLHAPKHKVKRMRDLPLWLRYYAALEDARVEQAQRIMDNLKKMRRVEHWEFFRIDRATQLEQLRQFSAAYSKEAIKILESLHDQSPPDAAYVRARQRAEDYLQQRQQKAAE